MILHWPFASSGELTLVKMKPYNIVLPSFNFNEFEFQSPANCITLTRLHFIFSNKNYPIYGLVL